MRAAPSPCACSKRWASDMKWLRVCTLEGNIINNQLTQSTFLFICPLFRAGQSLSSCPGRPERLIPGYSTGVVFILLLQMAIEAANELTRVRRGGELLTGGQWNAPFTSHLPALPSSTALPLQCHWFLSLPSQSSTENISLFLFLKILLTNNAFNQADLSEILCLFSAFAILLILLEN